MAQARRSSGRRAAAPSAAQLRRDEAASRRLSAAEGRKAAAVEAKRLAAAGREWARIERQLDAERRATAREEARLQREAHRADLARQRKREARARELAKRAKQRATVKLKATREKQRERLKRELKGAKVKTRKAPKDQAPKVKTRADALLAIGQLLGVAPQVDGSPISGRFVSWAGVARYRLAGMTYAELQPAMMAIATDDEIGEAIGLRSMTRIRVEYTGRPPGGRTRETREWTAGEIGPWEVTRERAERAVDVAAGKYESTVVNWLELWFSGDQASGTGEL